MLVHDWEIWHTYSSFLNLSKVDLETVAGRLIDAEMAHLVMHRDGLTVWRNNTKVCSGTTQIRTASDGTGEAFELIRDNEDDTFTLAGFAREVWSHACRFRFSEIRLFGSHVPLPEPYIRAYLGKCRLHTDENESQITLYPVVVLYETGVIMVEFRMIASDHPLHLADFVEGAVNLFDVPFSVAEVPPAVSRIAPRAWSRASHTCRIRERAALLQIEQQHDAIVADMTSPYDDGQFSFELAPLSNDSESEGETLNSLALTIMQCVAYLTRQHSQGWRFVLRGDASFPGVGEYWCGRPHIHLIRFDDQRETASENHRIHNSSFALIVARSPTMEPESARKYLPDSGRPFEDFASYITSPVFLWVWSKRGIRQRQGNSDPNRGPLVYENQAFAEMLSYSHIIHRRLLVEAFNLEGTPEVLTARRNLVELEQHMSEVSPYGEIREVLENAGVAMGLDNVKIRIKEALDIQGGRVAVYESRRVERVGRLLTVLFGLTAIPSLAIEVLNPMWTVFEMWRPASDELFSLMLNGVSVVIISIPVWLLMRPLAKLR